MTRLEPRLSSRRARYLVAGATSVAAVAAVTAVIFLLEPVAPVLSLGVLYLFAVLPVAAVWGLVFAVPVSLVSMLAFNWFFLPPTHTFRLADSENWVALAVYLVTAVSVSGLAARARRRAAEAEQQRREAALAAEISAILLAGGEPQGKVDAIAAEVAASLGARRGRIDLEQKGSAGTDETPYELLAGDRWVGRLFLDSATHLGPEVAARVLTVVASLLATELDRDRLAREAYESERRRREEAIQAETLRRSDTVKTAILRSVSHDLRSPITAIMAASEVLESSGEAVSAGDRDELLDSIRLQVRRLDRLVSNLLELSRLEAGAARPLPELWTVDGLVARALDALGPGSERVDVILGDCPPVRVDPAQLEHALVNLLENALRFSSPTDSVTVQAQHTETDVVIRVIDHGLSIPESEQTRIFEPFQRGTSEDGVRGSGLGLAIARGFVQSNGGRLWVESPPGGGAIFALALEPAPASVSAAP